MQQSTRNTYVKTCLALRWVGVCPSRLCVLTYRHTYNTTSPSTTVKITVKKTSQTWWDSCLAIEKQKNDGVRSSESPKARSILLRLDCISVIVQRPKKRRLICFSSICEQRERAATRVGITLLPSRKSLCTFVVPTPISSTTSSSSPTTSGRRRYRHFRRHFFPLNAESR